MPEIDKTYEPAGVEPKWYDFWLANGCFSADPARVSETRPAYSIVIPPPNVTGVLTLGHVLNNTIQDILARRARMQGKEVLWLPGTDHAGIATQNVVEKTLRKAGEIKHRDDLGREALVGKIWEWKEKYGGIIIQQLKKLGASCDWSRERFTMDAEYSRCVQSVFVDLYKKGLIYRGKRMVNWCPASLTALSDEEVIMKEQNGFLYYFKVEVIEEPGRFLTIATTRPETIPGDTAIAVNPKDPRYADLIGKTARRPLPQENQIALPIIGDDAVTFDFGTGVLKVTPAHDKADYEIGQRHQLPMIDVMLPNGVMNDLAGADLAGLERFAARAKSVELLKELGALEKEEPYKNNVGFSERADVPIESRLSEQWFLKYPSVEKSRAVVASGEMKFFPERWAKVYDHWLEGIQDWCISRQLWWGHRIPVWKLEHSREDFDFEFTTKNIGLTPAEEEAEKARLNSLWESVSPGESWPKEVTPRIFPAILGSGNGVDRWTKLDAITAVHEVATSTPDEGEWLLAEGYTQDTDVLDTWFSSWLWPFATMGWPEKTDTLAKFYPTTDLVTGPDIIFFWVARMIMAGFEWMGELPFKNVYFTGIIRDKQGRKMSKSLGNSPDPLEIIAKYGADALRFGVMRSAPLGADILFDEKNVELGRNFCTKLWNATRFRQMHAGEVEGEINAKLLSSDDKWILLKLNDAIRDVSKALDEYRFSDAAQALYRFFWTEFCDWYLETSKAALYGEDPARKANTLAVIDFILGHTLRLFHPFLPFITEELWHGLGYSSDLPEDQGGRTIMTARWPGLLGNDFFHHYDLDPSQTEIAEQKYETVNHGRSLRRDFNINNKQKVRFVLRTANPLPDHELDVLEILLNAEPLEVVEPDWTAPKGTPTVLTPLGELLLPLEGLVDVAAERERISKEMTKVEGELDKVRAKLADENFAAKVPAKVLDEHRQRERDWADKYAQLSKMRDALGAA
jgi:valyl-tRNA synthetase